MDTDILLKRVSVNQKIGTVFTRKTAPISQGRNLEAQFIEDTAKAAVFLNSINPAII